MNLFIPLLTACLSIFSAGKGFSLFDAQETRLWIDEQAKQTLEEWDIPGLALTVVHKGRDITVSGYGFKERGTSDNVTDQTIFQIASLTKAFTSLTVDILVKEDKLSWDEPIRSYLPSIKFQDPLATEQMTLTDLLSHQTGFPGIANDEGKLWYGLNHSTKDLITALADVKPLYPLSTRFTYSNLAYIVVSQVVAQAANMPWEQFCQERIFEPLHMTRSHISHRLLVNDDNVALPHLPSKVRKEPITFLNWDSLSAAGGITTCAKDMAYWLNYCLNSFPKNLKIFEPHSLVIAREIVGDEELSMWSIYAHDQEVVHYGFGWMMYKLNNKTVFFHLGLSDGMASMIAFVPEEDLGITVLTNQSDHLGDISLLNLLLDYFLGITKTDWHKKSHQMFNEIKKHH